MEHWIGIDVSSATLDFALLDGKGTHLESVQIENDRKAVMKLMGQWSKRHGVEVGKSLICLEATGHYTLMMLNPDGLGSSGMLGWRTPTTSSRAWVSSA
ncbi:MAG: transposase [Flavobacteriales bacterium]|nr:transposase [Flavobacteriales bacterium]